MALKKGSKKTGAKKRAPSTGSKSNEELRREHRAARQRQQKRRRLIFYVSLCIVVVIVGIVLSLTVFFKISKIEVKGDGFYSKEEIIASSGVNTGDNLFLLDRAEIRDRIGEKLPFVGGVELKISLPDKLVITVNDTSVKCAVQNGKSYVLINETGKVLGEVSDLKEVYEGSATEKDKDKTEKTETRKAKFILEGDKVIILKGIKIKSAVLGTRLETSNPKAFELYDEIMAVMNAHKLTGITEIDLSDTMAITMMYQDRIKIAVGSVSDLEDKIALAVTVIKNQNEISPYQEGTIDLSIGKKAYFSPAQEKETAKPTEAPSEKPPAENSTGNSNEKPTEKTTEKQTEKPTENKKNQAG